MLLRKNIQQDKKKNSIDWQIAWDSQVDFHFPAPINPPPPSSPQRKKNFAYIKL